MSNSEELDRRFQEFADWAIPQLKPVHPALTRELERCNDVADAAIDDGICAGIVEANEDEMLAALVRKARRESATRRGGASRRVQMHQARNRGW